MLGRGIHSAMECSSECQYVPELTIAIEPLYVKFIVGPAGTIDDIQNSGVVSEENNSLSRNLIDNQVSQNMFFIRKITKLTLHNNLGFITQRRRGGLRRFCAWDYFCQSLRGKSFY